MVDSQDNLSDMYAGLQMRYRSGVHKRRTYHCSLFDPKIGIESLTLEKAVNDCVAECLHAQMVCLWSSLCALFCEGEAFQRLLDRLVCKRHVNRHPAFHVCMLR